MITEATLSPERGQMGLYLPPAPDLHLRESIDESLAVIGSIASMAVIGSAAVLISLNKAGKAEAAVVCPNNSAFGIKFAFSDPSAPVINGQTDPQITESVLGNDATATCANQDSIANFIIQQNGDPIPGFKVKLEPSPANKINIKSVRFGEYNNVLTCSKDATNSLNTVCEVNQTIAKQEAKAIYVLFNSTLETNQQSILLNIDTSNIADGNVNNNQGKVLFDVIGSVPHSPNDTANNNPSPKYIVRYLPSRRLTGRYKNCWLSAVNIKPLDATSDYNKGVSISSLSASAPSNKKKTVKFFKELGPNGKNVYARACKKFGVSMTNKTEISIKRPDSESPTGYALNTLQEVNAKFQLKTRRWKVISKKNY